MGIFICMFEFLVQLILFSFLCFLCVFLLYLCMLVRHILYSCTNKHLDLDLDLYIGNVAMTSVLCNGF